MSLTAAESDKIVSAAIHEINHIATLPEVTLRIVELVEDPTATAQDLHKVISHDPALCSRILKVVNSAFYGLPGQIGSIERAIVLLGLNAVKNIAIAASLVKLYRAGEMGPNFKARDLWTHSVAVAAASKLITDALRTGMADEAFLAGLIHDIGIVVELQYDRKRFAEMIDQLDIDDEGAPRSHMMGLERQIFGATHQAFGRALCEKWKFPPGLTSATGWHHNPLDLPEERRMLPCIVHVADKVAGSLEGGFRLDVPDLEVSDEVLAAIRLPREKLAEIASALPEMQSEVRSLLG